MLRSKEKFLPTSSWMASFCVNVNLNIFPNSKLSCYLGNWKSSLKSFLWKYLFLHVILKFNFSFNVSYTNVWLSNNWWGWRLIFSCLGTKGEVQSSLFVEKIFPTCFTEYVEIKSNAKLMHVLQILIEARLQFLRL